MDTELEAVCELVRECGLLMRGADTSELLVNAKTGHANFVTDYDKRIQEKLRIGLAKAIPGATFIGEEDASQEYSEKGKFLSIAFYRLRKGKRAVYRIVRNKKIPPPLHI